MSLKILALSGSLRRASTNTALVRTFADLLPDGVELELHDYRDVPLFDSDLDIVPDGVDRLKRAIADADAVLIATPEYNHSVPGVLKNALDWASRPAYRSVFHGKPTAVVSAAAGVVGGARAQAHLKTILLGMGTPVFPWPELLVGQAGKKVEDGVITDETTRGFIERFAVGFTRWVETQRLSLGVARPQGPGDRRPRLGADRQVWPGAQRAG